MTEVKFKFNIFFLVLELQKKWKNLKDNFRRKCVSKSGMAATNKKCYTYSKVLEFLRPTMENRK